jgi:hypothetical protein
MGSLAGFDHFRPVFAFGALVVCLGLGVSSPSSSAARDLVLGRVAVLGVGFSLADLRGGGVCRSPASSATTIATAAAATAATDVACCLFLGAGVLRVGGGRTNPTSSPTSSSPPSGADDTCKCPLFFLFVGTADPRIVVAGDSGIECEIRLASLAWLSSAYSSIAVDGSSSGGCEFGSSWRTYIISFRVREQMSSVAEVFRLTGDNTRSILRNDLASEVRTGSAGLRICS